MLSTLGRFVSALGLRSFGTALERVSYYDLVLAVIPLTFLVATVLGQATSLSGRLMVTVASVVAGLTLVDALFLNPPGAAD